MERLWYGAVAMCETVTLQIPDGLARRARVLADATHRRFEDAIVDSLRRAVEALPRVPLNLHQDPPRGTPRPASSSRRSSPATAWPDAATACPGGCETG